MDDMVITHDMADWLSFNIDEKFEEWILGRIMPPSVNQVQA